LRIGHSLFGLSALWSLQEFSLIFISTYQNISPSYHDDCARLRFAIGE